jgi:tetratricopeptide (TPR) repeat protein
MTARAAYSTRQVANLLGLPERQVRSFVEAGFLEPVRGARGAFRFSFQDLVILRTAKGLCDAGIAAHRVRSALARLRAQLPRGRPLAAVRVTAEGGEVVARDGREVWEPQTGQRPLPYRDLERFAGFAVAELAERAAPLGRRAVAEAEARRDLDAEDWYELGYELEASAVGEAQTAYRRAVALDPTHADAHLNLGRLLHEAGDLAGAEDCYRRAAALRPGDATPWFNLGVALQDRERPAEAVAAYARALAADPSLADAHFNLAGLHSQLGDRPAALRHLKSYKALREG